MKRRSFIAGLVGLFAARKPAQILPLADVPMVFTEAHRNPSLWVGGVRGIVLTSYPLVPFKLPLTIPMEKKAE